MRLGRVLGNGNAFGVESGQWGRRGGGYPLCDIPSGLGGVPSPPFKRFPAPGGGGCQSGALWRPPAHNRTPEGVHGAWVLGRSLTDPEGHGRRCTECQTGWGASRWMGGPGAVLSTALPPGALEGAELSVSPLRLGHLRRDDPSRMCVCGGGGRGRG